MVIKKDSEIVKAKRERKSLALQDKKESSDEECLNFESEDEEYAMTLDLELVPKENRLDSGKYNGRIPHGVKPKEETFQVVLDALALTLRYPACVITADVPEVYMHHPQMKESKSYKTYLGYAPGTIPPKVARKFKKASPSKKDSMLVPADVEPVQKGKRVKRSAKKSSTTPTTCIVIRESHVETYSKRKEKVDVARGKGIDLLFEVALTEEAQMKEVRKKSLRD
nr:hypothetical protein [Tanacetum cinerariifolium]